jgi:ketosteroid isomerase-like protein
MKRSTVALAACLLVAVNVVHAASKNKDEQALHAQTVAWEKAFNGGDVKGVAAQYADDAVLMPPDSSAVRGRVAIERFFAKYMADGKAAGVTFAIDYPTEGGVTGNIGWESGTYKAMIKGNVVERGKFLSVSRKKGGKWLYIRDMWNADAPPAPPAPPPAPAAAAPAKK